MRLAVYGASGRMGQVLIKAISAHAKLELSAAIEAPGSQMVGEDAGAIAGIGTNGIHITDDIANALSQSDGVIDFTVPKATVSLVEHTAKLGKVHIIGTTGLNEAEEKQVTNAGASATIVKSGNMSLGVNLLAAMTKRVAAALDEDFDIEVLEMHHKHKIDAPSGTALLLGEAAAEGRGLSLKDRSVMSREGQTGARPIGDIGFATLRGGSVIGEHSVIFAGDSERIELTHKAEDRAIFANGALKAALWAKDQAPGRYSMLDVLGIA